MGSICAGITRTGGRCTQSVKPGETFCWNHDPKRQGERKRNAAKAGKSRPSREIAGIKDEIKTVISAVLDGSLETGPASVSIQGYNCLLRAFEVSRRSADMGDLLERLEAVEQAADRIRGA
ncbi:MAG: hypothetical protein M3Q49_07185 [Actinomycetota bacterium]|nr:hypothetical protein [Actinomycetota bacterium]